MKINLDKNKDVRIVTIIPEDKEVLFKHYKDRLLKFSKELDEKFKTKYILLAQNDLEFKEMSLLKGEVEIFRFISEYEWGYKKGREAVTKILHEKIFNVKSEMTLFRFIMFVKFLTAKDPMKIETYTYEEFISNYSNSNNLFVDKTIKSILMGINNDEINYFINKFISKFGEYFLNTPIRIPNDEYRQIKNGDYSKNSTILIKNDSIFLEGDGNFNILLHKEDLKFTLYYIIESICLKISDEFIYIVDVNDKSQILQIRIIDNDVRFDKYGFCNFIEDLDKLFLIDLVNYVNLIKNYR